MSEEGEEPGLFKRFLESVVRKRELAAEQTQEESDQEKSYRRKLGKRFLAAAVAYMALAPVLLLAFGMGDLAGDLLLMVITFLVAKSSQILDFVFGSSEGSKAKSVLIAEELDDSPDYRDRRPAPRRRPVPINPDEIG